MPQMTIDNHLITQFSDMMHIAAQQIRARLRPYVDIRKMDGDNYAYDGLGSVEAREFQTRITPTQFDDIDHNRRKISRRFFGVTLPMDQSDIEARLTDPQGNYAQACVRAMERVFDRVVIDALFATVNTSRDFLVPLTFAQDGGLTVNATSGLTYNQLIAIKQGFVDADVGNDMPVDIVLGIAGNEHTTLMKETNLINSQYTREVVVDKGTISKAAGFDLVKFAANAKIPPLSVTGGIRNCFAMAMGGVCVGLSRDWQITVKDRPDYYNVKQVQITGVLGAVRTEGKLVQMVQTTAS
jgi:hypothetical protein